MSDGQRVLWYGRTPYDIARVLVLHPSLAPRGVDLRMEHFSAPFFPLSGNFSYPWKERGFYGVIMIHLSFWSQFFLWKLAVLRSDTMIRLRRAREAPKKVRHSSGRYVEMTCFWRCKKLPYINSISLWSIHRGRSSWGTEKEAFFIQ